MPVQRSRHVSAGQRDHGGGVKAQRGPDRRALETGGTSGVPHQPVGEAKRQRVHRPGRRHAHLPVSEASGVVLDGGLRAALQHLDRRRCVAKVAEQTGVHVAGDERGRLQHLQQIIAVALDAGHARARQRHHQRPPRFLARGATGDDLGQHGIVVRRHRGAAIDGRLDAHAVGEDHLGEEAARGLKVALWILGIEPRLDRRADGARGARGQIGQLAGGQAHHPLDQIDAGHLLGHAVLDLDAGVDLQEVIGVVARVDGVQHELDRPRRTVARPAAQARRGLQQPGARRRREPGRRRLLDHLLVAPL